MRFKQLFESDDVISDIGIKDAFKGKTKHALNKFAKLTVYGVLKKYVKSQDLGKVAERFASRKFNLSEGTHSIDDAISDISVSKDFFKEIFNKKKAKNMNMMGPGELMLWAIYSNVNFNPTAGDLLIDGKVVEVKAARGQFGGDPKRGWKSWSDAKSQVKNVADDLDVDVKDLDKNAGLVQANLSSLFSIIKDVFDSKNQKDMLDLATALVNNESAAVFIKKLEKSLKKAKDSNDAWLMMLAVHSQIYQAKYKFEYIIKFNSVNRKFPLSVTVINPNAHSIEGLVEFFKSNNIKPEEWAKTRSGGMAAK